MKRNDFGNAENQWTTQNLDTALSNPDARENLQCYILSQQKTRTIAMYSKITIFEKLSDAVWDGWHAPEIVKILVVF